MFRPSGTHTTLPQLAFSPWRGQEPNSLRALSMELRDPSDGASPNGSACLRTLCVQVKSHSVT